MAPEADALRWGGLESRLDGLLDLDTHERVAALADVARQDPEAARVLAGRLESIEGSRGFMEPREDPAAPARGQQVGAWRLRHSLGRGGMGEVWLGMRDDGAFQKNVAVKFIRFDRPRMHERLVQERQVLARLEHPNIARLLDGGIDALGRPYLVAEFIDGRALDRWCVERAPPLDARLAVFRQIAEAVAYAHANLVVHRDLKAANTIVDAQGHAKLLDFGIAKLLDEEAGATAEHALSPDCAAPEQVTGAPITTRTDIYALGALLYQLLTGRTPLGDSNLPLADVVRRVCDLMPLPPSAVALGQGGTPLRQRSKDLDAIALKALSKDPQERYATVEAMLADLDDARALRPVSARRGSAFYRTHRFLRRHRVGVGVAVGLAATLLLGAGGTLWQARVAMHERDSALDLAERSDAARDFLVRLLSESKADAPLRPHEMIERAARLLAQEPAMRADVRAMTQNVIAELQLERRDYAGAAGTFRGLAEAAGDAPDELAIDAMCGLGAAEIALDHQAEAQRWLDRGLLHARRLEGSRRASLASCLSYASMRSHEHADRTLSLALAREAIDVIDHLGVRYPSRQSALHNNYANVLAAAGNAPAAIPEFRRALALLAEAGRSRSADYSTAEGNLASVLADVGLAREADAEYSKAIALRREVSGESIGLAQQMSLHASVLLDLDRPVQALSMLDQAAAMLAANNEPPGLRIAHVHLRRAGAYALLQRRDDAEREYDQTERVYAQVLKPQSTTRNNVELGRAALWMRMPRTPADLDRAGAQIDAAIARVHAGGATELPGSILRSEAELALDRGDAAGAATSALAARTRDLADLDPHAWQLAFDDALLGAASIRLGRGTDGRARLADALARIEDALGHEHWRARQARAWLSPSGTGAWAPQRDNASGS